MNYRVKKAIKAIGEEGDRTPQGTELYLVGELDVPEAVRKQAIQAGLLDSEKMYLTYQKATDEIVLMTSAKVENIQEEFEEIEINNLEDVFTGLAGVGLTRY